jgi:hypothetical protein
MTLPVLTAGGISLIPYVVDALLFLIVMSAELPGVTPQATLDPAHMHVGHGGFISGAKLLPGAET